MDIVLEHKDGWRRVRFLATAVPGLGYKAYAMRSESTRVESANATRDGSWEIESRFYRISLDSTTGAITHLIDKELKRDLVDQNAPYQLNQLVYAAGGENQRIIRDMFPYTPTKLDVTGQTGAQLVESVRTPHGQRIRITAQARNVPLIESEITVYDDLKRVDIRNHIRKEDIRAKEAIYPPSPSAPPHPSFCTRSITHGRGPTTTSFRERAATGSLPPTWSFHAMRASPSPSRRPTFRWLPSPTSTAAVGRNTWTSPTATCSRM